MAKYERTVGSCRATKTSPFHFSSYEPFTRIVWFFFTSASVISLGLEKFFLHQSTIRVFKHTVLVENLPVSPPLTERSGFHTKRTTTSIPLPSALYDKLGFLAISASRRFAGCRSPVHHLKICFEKSILNSARVALLVMLL